MRRALPFFFVLIIVACNTVPQSIPTPTPTHTARPIHTPTSTATATPTDTPVPGGPCDNPLVPLAPGNQWEYRLQSINGESFFTIRSTGRQDTSYIVTMVEYTDHKNNFTIEKSSICQSGAIEKFPIYVLNMLFIDILEEYFSAFQESGTYAPSYRELSAANWKMEWQTNYLTEDAATIINPLGSPNLRVSNQQPLTLVSTTDGSHQDVTTPAGDFPQALKLSQVYSIRVTFLEGTTGGSGILNLYTSQWYVPYVGLVRAQVDDISLTVNGFENRLTIESTLELMEFKPGN